MSVVEEWFDSLKPSPRSKLNEFLLKHYRTVEATAEQFSRVGMAVFLSAYIFFKKETPSFAELVYALSIALILWSVFSVFRYAMVKFLLKRVFKNIIPSVILLTQADIDAFAEVEAKMNSVTITWFGLFGTMITGIFINIVSSYLYAGLTLQK